MSLQFLRPMALPRPSTLRHFFGVARLSTTSSVEAATTSAASSPVPNQPYLVTRTTTNNLPIYLLAKRGGNLKQTRIRKIEGNVQILKKQLQEELGLDEKDVVINSLTKHIIIKVSCEGPPCSFGVILIVQ